MGEDLKIGYVFRGGETQLCRAYGTGEFLWVCFLGFQPSIAVEADLPVKFKLE
jgi:hypothetical protein